MIRISPPSARSIGWSACFILVYVSAFFLSGTEAPPLALDPSWHVALEYAAAHHLQFGTQIVFTFGPLGFLSTRTSLGHLLGARVAFAFFWSTVVALAATALANRLPGWIRYAFLAWLVVFTLSEGLDQTAYFVLAYGVLLLLTDEPKQRWQAPLFILAFIVLSLIKLSFLTAALVSLAIVIVCWIRQRKTVEAIVLALAAPSGFVACWAALGQSPSHLAPWFRHGLELESGYSAAMNLVPKTSALCAGLGALGAFVGALMLVAARARRNLLTLAIMATVAQYVFLAWKEGFTRSGDWHVFIFLWFLPLGLTFCFLVDRPSAAHASSQRLLEVLLAASFALSLAAAHFQIPGFALQKFLDWPRRTGHNAEMILAIVRGHASGLYADCANPDHARMLVFDRAKTVIGSESVDVMNYLGMAAVINGMNYCPRPVFQAFVAYTPALQDLNAEYFRGEERPRFVMLSQQATDGRFPTLEDSAALNYVLNNYVPVARDGRFLILQQRTAVDPAFQLVHEETLHFGEKLDLRPWAQGPLFMSVAITPTLLGRAATFLYQQQPLYMRLTTGQAEERYRIVPSMAELPFLVNPLLNSNYDVLNLYISHPGKEPESVTFERPEQGSFEFRNPLTVRLYTVPAFPRAARETPVSRMIADVQGRVFWPDPKSVESVTPVRLTIFRGIPALIVHAPSKVVVEIPAKASSFTGYFGIPEEASTGDGKSPGVMISIAVQDLSGKSRLVFERLLQPLSRADDRGRLPFRVPIDGARDRSITLNTSPVPSGGTEGNLSIWSQCRFEELPPR